MTAYIIYILGVFISYPSLKSLVKWASDNDSWTNRDRMIGILISLCSWITVISIVFIYIRESLSSDKKASW